MTEEEIKVLQDAKEAAETRAVEAEALAVTAKEEADKATSDVTKVVDELKEERLKKNEALEKAKLISKDGTDLNALIEDAFKNRDTKDRETSFIEALTEFKTSKTEFQSDTTGLVATKFEEDLKRFNFSDVQTKEQMKTRLEEAYAFLNHKPSEEQGQEYGGSTPTPPVTPANADEALKNVETVLEQTGMSDEKFKSLREKYPEALGNLGIE